MANAHMVISGLVQGVGYRWFVMRKAQEYNLTGYVSNLYNGDVEIEVEGHRSMIVDFAKELKVGPRSGHVTDMKIDWGEYEDRYGNFDIKF
ncbi:MAG: acylphosphatase [Candidatus Zixiibacteriota bacterium]